MDNVKLNKKVCRICLEDKKTINWNEEIENCGISYKDCYYKYTQMQPSVSDNFTTKLCDMCSNGLKNAHILFEKALESFRILNSKQCSSSIEEEKPKVNINTDLTIEHFDDDDCIPSDSDEKAQIDLELKLVTDIKIDIPDDNTSVNDDSTLEFEEHFMEITNYESSSGDLKEDPKAQNIKEKSPEPSTSTKKTKRVKKYMCTYCSLKLKDYNSLQKHEDTHSENRERNETCPHCGIKLYTKGALREHIKIHDEKREKNFKCEYCDKAFYNRGALNVHRRIHLGQMIPCPICPKEFYRQIDLSRHLLSIHSVTPDGKAYKKPKYMVLCKHCNTSIPSPKWREHEAKHLNQPQVKCKICNKDFFVRSKCTNHLSRSHRKSKAEFEEFIYYYIKNELKTSHLKLKQQNVVQPVVPE